MDAQPIGRRAQKQRQRHIEPQRVPSGHGQGEKAQDARDGAQKKIRGYVHSHRRGTEGRRSQIVQRNAEIRPTPTNATNASA